MSLYNMLFGQNPASDVYLAMLGLTRETVGRFRDCYVDKTDSGEVRIVVHTRNGGGNRECGCLDSPEWGSRLCKHHTIEVDAPTFAFMPKSEWPDGKAPGNFFTTRDGVAGCEYRTGETHKETRYVCEQPNSIACACTGCTIEYRLPAHPLYITDEDDDFDCTYADVYFRAPEEYREFLEAIAENKPFKPSDKWQALFAKLEAAKLEAAK